MTPTVLQFDQAGPRRDYLFGEKVCIILSLTAKALLARRKRPPLSLFAIEDRQR